MSDMFNYSVPSYNFGTDSNLGLSGTGSLWSNYASSGNSSGVTGNSLNFGNNATSGLTGSASNTLGANIPTFQLGLSGLSAIGNLWGAFQSNKLANQQFDYTKQITNTNLANQIQSYNTALSDKATARASMEGWSDAETQNYINKNKLSS